MTPQPTPSRWRRRTVVLLAGLALALHGLVVGAPGAAAQSSFTFTGGGRGHGVGMSQWGARGMAANGWTWGQILTHYYSGTSVGTQGTSDDLKVLVAQKTSTFTLVTGGTTTLMGVGTVPGGRTLTLTRAGDGVRVTGALNATTPGPILVSYEGAGALKVSPPGYSYAYGLLGIGPDAAGGLRAVVGDLSMQQYLYGIGEMPSSWPAEALKAQATASRTFAQKRRAARSAALSASRMSRPWSVPSKVQAEPAAASTALPSFSSLRPFATPPRCAHRGLGSGAAPALSPAFVGPRDGPRSARS